MRRPPMALRGLTTGLALVGLLWAAIASADPREDRPLPGSRLELRPAADQAEAIAIGGDFRGLVAGGGHGYALWCAEVVIKDCLKGDLPRGPLRINAILVRDPEALPSRDAGKGKDEEYLLFVTRTEGRGHRVIKMLHATEENVRSVTKLLPKRLTGPRVP